jgi:ArsR family metal-binding transcriptional regulator
VFLESIRIIETSPCLADTELFKGKARASADLTEILPYLNSIVEKPNYQLSSNSLVFKQGIIGITLKDDMIAMTRFANLTQAHELLDWIKDLINDTYESRSEITPNYKGRKQLGLLQIYGMLPKKNCGKCGEQSCMAFAGKLSKLDAEIDDCPLFSDAEYMELKEKLINAFED